MKLLTVQFFSFAYCLILPYKWCPYHIIYQTPHKFLFTAQDTAQYDLLEMTSEWTQMSVTGRGSLPLNWGCISRGGGAQFMGPSSLGGLPYNRPLKTKTTTLT